MDDTSMAVVAAFSRLAGDLFGAGIVLYLSGRFGRAEDSPGEVAPGGYADSSSLGGLTGAQAGVLQQVAVTANQPGVWRMACILFHPSLILSMPVCAMS